jgi:hypothetical protein
MIDYNEIYTTFITLVEDQVGDLLATYKGAPAVLRVRQKTPTKDYPYITVELSNTEDEDGWQRDEYYNDDGHTVHETIKRIMVTFRVYGGGTESSNDLTALNIANQLHGSFTFNSVREGLRNDIEAGIVMVDAVRTPFVQLPDRYLETAMFFVMINIIDEQIDTTSTLITEIGLDGEMAPPDDIENPIPITVITIDPTP